MSSDPLRPLDFGTATPEEVRERMVLGVRKALLEHKRAGRSIVVWDREHDRIVHLPPEQISTFDDAAPPAGLDD